MAFALLVALIDVMRRETLALDLGGRDLTLIEAASALRLLVWFNLIGALFLPIGMARSDAGTVTWAAALITWLARTLLFAASLALLDAGLGRIGLVRAARVLGVAVLLGLLAVVFLLADMGTA